MPDKLLIDRKLLEHAASILKNANAYRISTRELAAEELRGIIRSSPTPVGFDHDVDAMVIRFLSWPLPEKVCADPCASMPGYPHRAGTNLLNAEQAKAMLLHVLAASPSAEGGE